MTANRNVLWSRGGPRLLTVATALAVVLANVAMAADQAGAVGPPTMSAQRGGPQEGVRVRGHWVLDVRNPDGTLADRRDFHNAYLAEFGSLPLILARSFSMGPWFVLLEDGTSANPPACGASAPCALLQGPPGPGFFNLANLAIVSTALSMDLNQQELLLTGSFTAAAGANITRVTAWIGMCPAAAAPSACGLGPTVRPFSGTSAFTPVSVLPGRIVQVAVTFTFS